MLVKIVDNPYDIYDDVVLKYIKKHTKYQTEGYSKLLLGRFKEHDKLYSELYHVIVDGYIPLKGIQIQNYTANKIKGLRQDLNVLEIYTILLDLINYPERAKFNLKNKDYKA